MSALPKCPACGQRRAAVRDYGRGKTTRFKIGCLACGHVSEKFATREDAVADFEKRAGATP